MKMDIDDGKDVKPPVLILYMFYWDELPNDIW